MLAARARPRDSRAMRGFILSCLIFLFTTPLRAEDVTVFAAASLAGPLDLVADTWEEDTGHTVTRVYAGSSAIARQVAAGAPADVVFLASTDWMDDLVARDAILSSSTRQILSNRLVVIVNTRVHGTLEQDSTVMPLEGRMALALTDAVPAGIYARAALVASGAWDDVRDRVVEADNVRAATRLVAIGAVERGIVYATEAVSDPRVTVIEVIAEDLHPPIRYPAALTYGASAEAAAFLAYLESGAARAIFNEAGFGAIGP